MSFTNYSKTDSIVLTFGTIEGDGNIVPPTAINSIELKPEETRSGLSSYFGGATALFIWSEIGSDSKRQLLWRGFIPISGKTIYIDPHQKCVIHEGYIVPSCSGQEDCSKMIDQIKLDFPSTSDGLQSIKRLCSKHWFPILVMCAIIFTMLGLAFYYNR